ALRALFSWMLPKTVGPAGPIAWARIRRFARGAGGINLTAIIFLQGDKLLLSFLLPLEQFGYYTIASMAAQAIAALAAPLLSAMFPRLSELVAKGDPRLAAIYHHGCQLMSLIVLPATFVIVFFTHEALFVWLGNTPAIVEIAPVLRLLSVGTALNSLY